MNTGDPAISAWCEDLEYSKGRTCALQGGRGKGDDSSCSCLALAICSCSAAPFVDCEMPDPGLSSPHGQTEGRTSVLRRESACSGACPQPSETATRLIRDQPDLPWLYRAGALRKGLSSDGAGTEAPVAPVAARAKQRCWHATDSCRRSQPCFLTAGRAPFGHVLSA